MPLNNVAENTDYFLNIYLKQWADIISRKLISAVSAKDYNMLIES